MDGLLIRSDLASYSYGRNHGLVRCEVALRRTLTRWRRMASADHWGISDVDSGLSGYRNGRSLWCDGWVLEFVMQR